MFVCSQFFSIQLVITIYSDLIIPIIIILIITRNKNYEVDPKLYRRIRRGVKIRNYGNSIGNT